MNKLYILLFVITSIVYSTCSFTMMDEYKARHKEKCLDNKILSDKRCSDLGSYIKRCGVAVLTLGMKIMPSGEVVIDTKNIKVSDGSPDTKSKEENQTMILKIFKYGSPHGMGNTYPSRQSCEQAQARFTKENAGLDYTYKCIKK